MKRFWDKVDMSDKDGCWEWTAYRNYFGHGRFRLNGKLELAHRVSYEMHKGRIPNGMNVCHVCDNPPCVNPNHLFLGTQQDNVSDRDAKDRQAVGEQNGKTKITEDDAIEIQRLYNTGKYTQERLGQMFGMSRGGIGSILAGTRWQRSQIETTFTRRPINKEIADEIRNKYGAASISQSKIGEKYGICQSAVSRILSGETYS